MTALRYWVRTLPIRLAVVGAALVVLLRRLARPFARVACVALRRHRDLRAFRRFGEQHRHGFRPAVVYRCTWCGMGALAEDAPDAVVYAARRTLTTRGGRR